MLDARARRRRIACCMLHHRWVAALRGESRVLGFLLLLESAAMDWLKERVDQWNEGAARSLFYVSSSRLALHWTKRELASIIDTLDLIGLRLNLPMSGHQVSTWGDPRGPPGAYYDILTTPARHD